MLIILPILTQFWQKIGQWKEKHWHTLWPVLPELYYYWPVNVWGALRRGIMCFPL